MPNSSAAASIAAALTLALFASGSLEVHMMAVFKEFLPRAGVTLPGRFGEMLVNYCRCAAER
ncbi:hypothetical protein [Streptomyces sp. NPDC048473]|uniref:hypothetical protein n=1 Tax=unclassified Streptomyces TaxID=2593676 RepID=UPI003710C1C4